MTNDELVKRELIAYVAMTVSLWLISWAMKDNGAASPRNPAWVLISNLRNFLTGIALAVIALMAIAWIATMLLEHRFERKERHRQALLDEEERKQQARRRKEFERSERKKLQEEEQSRILEEQARAEIRQRKITEKQERSAEDATQIALSDF